MKESDALIIELALRMRSVEITKETQRSLNACGSGALAATVAAVKAMGAEKGYLLEYITSHDVMPEGEFAIAVGYAGILF
jgi:AmmeMemoRadiSam system protein B